jgi:hypothetical protein
MTARASAVSVLALVACTGLATARGTGAVPAPAGQQVIPPLQAEVDMLTVDAQVVASRGPVANLTADDFQITISRRARPVILVEFLHFDEGPIARDLRLPPPDAGIPARCVFGFARSQEGAHAHYRLGVESIPEDARGIKSPKIRMRDKNLVVRRAGWRSR